MGKLADDTKLELAVVESNVKDLATNLTAGLFNPSSAQRRVKSTFHSRYTPSPFNPELGDVTLSLALQVTNSSSLRSWWSQPGFRDWFLNREEGREHLEYLFNLGVSEMENILSNPDTAARDKLAAIKMISELTGRISGGRNGVGRSEGKFEDEDINKMDENQLRTYLTRKGVTINLESQGAGGDAGPANLGKESK